MLTTALPWERCSGVRCRARGVLLPNEGRRGTTRRTCRDRRASFPWRAARRRVGWLRRRFPPPDPDASDWPLARAEARLLSSAVRAALSLLARCAPCRARLARETRGANDRAPRESCRAWLRI